MTVIMFGALLVKVVDFLRLLADSKNQKSGLVTQATAWVGGIILVMLCAHASGASNLVLPGSDGPLHTINIAGQVLLGLLVSSLGSLVVDLKQSFDNQDSAAKPALIPVAPLQTTPPEVVDAVDKPVAKRTPRAKKD